MERDRRGRILPEIADENGMKICCLCNRPVHISQFRKDKDRHDGLSNKCRPCANSWHREYRKLNPGLRERYAPSIKYPRKSYLKREYKLTQSEYEEMLYQQSGGCAVCGKTAPGGRGSFHIDHNHESGVIRGLLCAPCNMGIGQLGDSADRLRLAIAYLERPR